MYTAPAEMASKEAGKHAGDEELTLNEDYCVESYRISKNHALVHCLGYGFVGSSARGADGGRRYATYSSISLSFSSLSLSLSLALSFFQSLVFLSGSR